MNIAAINEPAHLQLAADRPYRPLYLFTIVLAVLAVYVPIYRELADSLWQHEAYAHGPLVLLAVLALFGVHGTELSRLAPTQNPLTGCTVLLAGLAVAWLGLTRLSPTLMAASHLPVFTGIVMTLWGNRGLRTLWFPLLYLCFVIPLPGIFIEVITWQLKEWIAQASVALLDAMGYPVARGGMIILVGQYQMLIANACSGLHSMLSLSALGMFYTYLAARRDPLRATLLLGGMLPIALLANLVRTLVLLLVTFHVGDAAGRHWHELMGIIIFVLALGMLLAFDKLLVRTLPGRTP